MKTDSIQKLNESIEQLLQQDEKPLTFREASEYLGLSKSHLYKLTSANKIAFFKPAGKMIYFKRSDLNKYLFRNRKASENELEQIAVDRVYQSA
jgi:excisionase family DNA binding protein